MKFAYYVQDPLYTYSLLYLQFGSWEKLGRNHGNCIMQDLGVH